MQHWIYLAVAIVSEVIATSLLKASAGFSRLWPSLIVLVGYVDSVQKKGTEISRLRTTFAHVPDAPVTKFQMHLFGGKRGLLENSANLCAARRHVTIRMRGQNGRLQHSSPVLPTSCGKKKKRKKRQGHRS